MFVIRPISQQDKQALLDIAKQAGTGFTSLPDDPSYLGSKIDRSIHSLTTPVNQPGQEHYLFVLEDSLRKQVIGTCGIKAIAGMNTPIYHFHLRRDHYFSQGLQIKHSHDVMHLCTHYSAHSEVGSLYLHPQSRQRYLGRLLAQCRYLFMHQHPQRFTPIVMAQLRGYCDSSGNSPFWQWMQQHFYHCSFETADTLTGKGDKQFIAELAPRHPLYMAFFPRTVKDVIGKVHEHTVPAQKMLEKEGFSALGYVDIFDAGPTLQASLSDLKSVRNSARLPCHIVNGLSDANPTHTLINTQLTNFRATIGSVFVDMNRGTVNISQQIAHLLQVSHGDPICFTPFS
jgi:arginine N-succinyltransferase